MTLTSVMKMDRESPHREALKGQMKAKELFRLNDTFSLYSHLAQLNSWYCICADHMRWDCTDDNMNKHKCFMCTFYRKHEEEILQKPFQKGRHSKVTHRSSHSNEVDRYGD